MKSDEFLFTKKYIKGTNQIKIQLSCRLLQLIFTTKGHNRRSKSIQTFTEKWSLDKRALVEINKAFDEFLYIKN